MKLACLLLVSILFTGILACGQTYLNEDFSSGQMPTAGWSIIGMAAQWLVTPPAAVPGTTTIDVFAQNKVAHNQHAVNFLYTTGLEEPGDANLSVYPNSASVFVYILGAAHAGISLVSPIGVIIRQVKDFSGDRIDLAGLAKVVYLL